MLSFHQHLQSICTGPIHKCFQPWLRQQLEHFITHFSNQDGAFAQHCTMHSIIYVQCSLLHRPRTGGGVRWQTLSFRDRGGKILLHDKVHRLLIHDQAEAESKKSAALMSGESLLNEVKFTQFVCKTMNTVHRQIAAIMCSSIAFALLS